MKKITLLLLTLLSCFAVQAQSFRIGPAAQGGINFTEDSKIKPDYSIGVKGELDFKDAQKGWYLDAAIMFTNRNLQSNKYYELVPQVEHYWTMSNYSITVPFNVGYKCALSNNLSLFTAVGPYFDLGLTGTCKKYTQGSGSTRSEIKTSTNVYKDKLFNRFHMGAEVKVGLDIATHYQVSLSFSHSLTHLQKNSNEMKNRSLQLGFAYMF